jgi:2,3,4,5-tetrahydropyridine-2-carboxylate N-succinyltransferase
MEDLSNIIEKAWQDINVVPASQLLEAVNSTISMLDQGQIRVAEHNGCAWVVNEWIKKAILLQFRLSDNKFAECGEVKWFDKISLKWADWKEEDFKLAGFRALPGAIVRRGAYIAKNAILMPSFVNIGAYVGSGTMVDTWATIGSCAQIGANCHISGGVGIGGVLEPLQANPVIIEDDCFIGARSEIAEGVIVERGAVISMGVYIGSSTRIINRETGEIIYGRVPAYSVVVPGGHIKSGTDLAMYSAIIVKQVDEQTRSKVSINELLRS